jgi:hypothetical protein
MERLPLIHVTYIYWIRKPDIGSNDTGNTNNTINDIPDDGCVRK